MPYPLSLQESLNKVNATRASRLREKVPRLSLEERDQLLRAYHPDHRPGAGRELVVGPNRGERLPLEVADVLEAPSRVDPEMNVERADVETDVLVVGGGGGGVTAALFATETGAKVLLATKLRLGDSNTVMSEGGIAAATRPNDAPALHFLDTMGGGLFCNDRNLVRALVLDAPMIVEWLKDLGVMFDYDPELNMVVSFAGGHSRRRVHSCRDLSGLEMMRVLRDELRCREIEVMEFWPCIELLLDREGRCAGAVLESLETGRRLVVHARAVILATGGLGRLHVQGFPTSNHYGATGDGLVLAYRAGCRLVFMDAIQYHPTGAAWPEQMFGQLITEALRGNGAHLVNCEGQRFINELETRDTTSSAIIRECLDRGKGVTTPTGRQGVWLDTPVVDMVMGRGTLMRLFSGIVRRFRRYGIDPLTEPLLVFPTQHYQNGGVYMNEHGETEVPGLYVAGEVGGGVHGRNRLGGNSLVDVFVFGRRAGLAAADYARRVTPGLPTLEHVRRFHAELRAAGVDRPASPRLLPDYVRRPQAEAEVAKAGL